MSQFTHLKRLARRFPEGSSEREALMGLLREASPRENYQTEGGLKYTIKTVELAKFLHRVMGLRPGVEAGPYLREEKRVPDNYVNILRREYGATFKRVPREVADPFYEPRPRISYEDLRDRLYKAIRGSLRGSGRDYGDFFLQWTEGSRHQPNRWWDPDNFESYLANISGDLSMNWEYGLSGTGQKVWKRMREMIDNGQARNWDGRLITLQDAREQIGSYYADEWYGNIVDAWREAQKNKKRFRELVLHKYLGWYGQRDKPLTRQQQQGLFDLLKADRVQQARELYKSLHSPAAATR